MALRTASRPAAPKSRCAWVVSAPLRATARAAQPVQPWEKRLLAQRAMRMDGGNALERDFARQVETSREAARGGEGVGGGGCGCN